jgi:hypothetical protein
MPRKPDPKHRVLVLRTCRANGASNHTSAFIWPEKGYVSAPDWSPEPCCGAGLHGWLWGAGDASHANGSLDARWLVVEVDGRKLVELNGKVKFPEGWVVFCGPRPDAAAYIQQRAPAGTPVIYGASTSGYGGTSTSGYGGTSTSGYGGTSTSGDGGTSTSGYGGTSTSGDGGTSTSGDGGTSTSGDGGTSTSGYGGTSTSGDGGTIQIRWWDGVNQRYRWAIGEVGIDGIKPNVPYIVVDGKLAEKPAVVGA